MKLYDERNNVELSSLFSDANSLTSAQKAAASLGSNKLSKKILYRLYQRNIRFEGKTYPGASSKEIDCMIHLSTICEQDGSVKDLSIKMLQSALDCSLNGVYSILDSLKKKGFIAIDFEINNGYRDVTILNNDYSPNSFFIKDLKHHAYLNTNIACFTDINGDFRNFQKLSLYAKRMFLLLLLHYDRKYGYRLSVQTAAKELSIANYDLIYDYIKEIQQELAMDEDLQLLFDAKKRKKERLIRLKSCFSLETNAGMTNGHASALRYQLLTFMERHHIYYYPTSDFFSNPFNEKVKSMPKCQQWQNRREEELTSMREDIFDETAKMIVHISIDLKQNIKNILDKFKEFLIDTYEPLSKMILVMFAQQCYYESPEMENDMI